LTSNYALNQVFRSKWAEPLHSYVVNFLRKIESAFQEYRSARGQTLLFSGSQRQEVSSYFRALAHWENFLANCSHAQNLLATFTGVPTFEKGDGTAQEKINCLYNHLKHVDSRIELGSILQGKLMPVWMTNDGLLSADASLSYTEAADCLLALVDFADILKDPQSARERAGQIQQVRLRTPSA
jgi:hypothetical protein